MASISILFDGKRVHDMGDSDGTSGVSTYLGGGGGGLGAEPDFFYQGANSVSRSVGTTLRGIQVDTSGLSPGLANFNSAMWMCKVIATNKDALLAVGSPALQVRIGDNASNYFAIDLHGNETYPPVGGWIIVPINLQEASNRSNVTGSVPSYGGVDWFAVVGDFTGSSANPNVAMDAIDGARGLKLIGGDNSPIEPGTFLDFVDEDQGVANNRWGFFQEQEGIITVFGNNWIGQNLADTAVATEFSDTSRILVFPNGFFGAGDCGMSVDLGTSTNVTWDNITIIGRGRYGMPKFDTELDVDNASDEIRSQEVIDAFEAGDPVAPRDFSGNEDTTISITPGTLRFIGKDLTATPTGVTLHSDRTDALLESGSPGSGTPQAIAPSSAGDGEIWALERHADSRPFIFVQGTTGSFSMNGCTFRNLEKITLTSAASLNDCVIAGINEIVQGGGAIDGCDISGLTYEPSGSIGRHLVDSDDLESITNTHFNNSNDINCHAVEGTETGTKSFTGNTFTGFHAVTDQTKHLFNANDDVSNSPTGITLPAGHGYVTGDAVVYTRNETGNTNISGLSSETIYYARVTGNFLALHLNKGDALNDNSPRVLTARTDSPAQTHALWPANAAFFNNTTGALTLNVTDGDVPSVRNYIGATTTINNNVSVTLTDLVENTEVRVYAAGSPIVAIDGIEDISSPTSFTFQAQAGIEVDIRIFNIDYRPADILGFTTPASAATIPIQQKFDRNYENP